MKLSAEDLEYVLKKEGDPFHLLLLDIQLPENSGLVFA